MDPDTLTIVLYECNPRFIMTCRLVCKAWKITIDEMTTVQWKYIYSYQTGLHIDVGDDFDWKRAAIGICTNEASIIAKWNTYTIRMVAPCTRTGLRLGIVPHLDTVKDTHGCCLDYVYDDAFCLRAIRCSCKRQSNAKRCVNCQNPRGKRHCLTPAYSYHVREYGNVTQKKLNECILLRIRV